MSQSLNRLGGRIGAHNIYTDQLCVSVSWECSYLEEFFVATGWASFLQQKLHINLPSLAFCDGQRLYQVRITVVRAFYSVALVLSSGHVTRALRASMQFSLMWLKFNIIIVIAEFGQSNAR